ncbi:MAG: hypothetical protein ABIL37_05770 [candidate division WOR-3 bacterium]
MTPKYAILTCPVCWSEVEFDDSTKTYQVNEYILMFCSDECLNKFNEDPDYYSQIIISTINHKCCCGKNCNCS